MQKSETVMLLLAELDDFADLLSEYEEELKARAEEGFNDFAEYAELIAYLREERIPSWMKDVRAQGMDPKWLIRQADKLTRFHINRELSAFSNLYEGELNA